MKLHFVEVFEAGIFVKKKSRGSFCPWNSLRCEPYKLPANFATLGVETHEPQIGGRDASQASPKLPCLGSLFALNARLAYVEAEKV